MQRQTFLITLLLLISAIGIKAQSLVAHKGKVKDGYNFWLYQPKEINTPKPVVIFLHGASLCGRDMNKVRRYGTIDAVEKGRQIEAFVLAPQNPGGAWKPEKVMNVLDWVKANHKVDTTRIYVLGMSLGGYGTIDFATTYPDKVTAAMAFCGGGTKKDYSTLTQVPLWIVHGTADRAVSVKQSDIVVNAMKKCEGGAPRLHYDRIAGMNHSAPARIFYMKECYEWLFEHCLTDSARTVAPKFTISNQTLRTAYRDLSSRKQIGLIKH